MPTVTNWTTLKEMTSEPGLQSLQYLQSLEAFQEPLAALAARVGEDRSAFLDFLKASGVESLGDRQLFANSLVRGARDGHITAGWARPEPSRCSHCAALPTGTKALLTCGRCKTAKYCNAGCQRAHWAAGHKAQCQRPPRPAGFANVPEGTAETHGRALPPAWGGSSVPAREL